MVLRYWKQQWKNTPTQLRTYVLVEHEIEKCMQQGEMIFICLQYTVKKGKMIFICLQCKVKLHITTLRMYDCFEANAHGCWIMC